MKLFLAILTVAFFNLGVSKALSEQEIVAEREFKDWSVFIDGGDCWITSYLDPKISSDTKNIYYFVTFYKDDPIPRISIELKNELNLRDVILFIIGRENFEFSISDGSAYPLSDDEFIIFGKMLKTEPLEIFLNDDRGNIYAANLSYVGFQDALNYVVNVCSFRTSSTFSSLGRRDRT